MFKLGIRITIAKYIFDAVEELPLCYIKPNLNTAAYQLGCSLLKSLSRQNHLQYTIESSIKFVFIIIQQIIANSCKQYLYLQIYLYTTQLISF